MDEALAMLDGLGDRPLAEHVEQFETVHKALVDTLSAIDKD